MKKENKILLIGCGISLLIFLFLFIVRAYKEDWLDINIQWIGVAILPLIFVLLLGKFIKKFSGFGVEFELVSEAPLSTTTTIIDMLQPAFAKNKESIHVLLDMSLTERSKINVLRFQSQKLNYYNDNVVMNYLNSLPNIKFFEIVDESGKYKSLTRIKADEIRHLQQFNLIQSFIISVETNRGVDLGSTTTSHLDINTTATNALKEIRKSGKNFVAVIDSKYELVGVLFKTKLEEYLATTLVNAIDRDK